MAAAWRKVCTCTVSIIRLRASSNENGWGGAVGVAPSVTAVMGTALVLLPIWYKYLNQDP